MFKVLWVNIKGMMSPPVRCLRELNLTKERTEVGCLKTGAKVYGRRCGVAVEFWVASYRQDFGDIRGIISDELLKCFCGKVHRRVSAYGGWCCPDALQMSR